MARKKTVELRARQVATEIWLEIVRGELKNGTVLPKGHELQAKYGVSQNVIQAARKMLVQTGCVRVGWNENLTEQGTIVCYDNVAGISE